MIPAVWVESVGPPAIGIDPPPGVPPRPTLVPTPTMAAGPMATQGVSYGPCCRPPNPPLTHAACRCCHHTWQHPRWYPCLVGAVFVAQLLHPCLVGAIFFARLLHAASPCPSPFLGRFLASPITPVSLRPHLPAAAVPAMPVHHHPPPLSSSVTDPSAPSVKELMSLVEGVPLAPLSSPTEDH